MLKETIVIGFIAGVYALWIVCTFIVQFKGTNAATFINNLDPLGVVPVWTFFAPHPLTHDFQILYRYKLSDGSETSWRIIQQPFSGIDFIINPHKRYRKAILDHCSIFCSTILTTTTDPNDIKLSLPYIAILYHISSNVSNPLADEVQFTIATSYNTDKNHIGKVVFVSNYHKVNSNEY